MRAHGSGEEEISPNVVRLLYGLLRRILTVVQWRLDRRDVIGRHRMPWRDMLNRTSLILGLIALGLSIWGGMHLQHLIDDKGNRHLGETVVVLVLALLVFTGCWYGARRGTWRE